ncbi:MAG: 16S rRNA (uracil(1498)-N(3))-methyltransferase [Coriobacteriia bacterium]|nr:16S rRNA (uracil(1498)-N(3))-methyltransferase [Coriobacteriia bacterium]
MAAHRFFASNANAAVYTVGATVPVLLDTDALRHASQVARVRVGECIEVVVRGEWRTWRCEVLTIDIEELTVRVLELLASTELPMTLDLFWGYAKGDKNERIVRSAVELGIRTLCPVRFARCEVRTSGFDEARLTKKRARLEAVTRSAAAQAHRDIIPEVFPLISIDELGQRLTRYDAVVVLWEEADAEPSLSTAVSKAMCAGATSVALIVGPEGGIEAAEVAKLQAHGAVTATLGNSILRVETACAAACAIAAEAARTQMSV